MKSFFSTILLSVTLTLHLFLAPVYGETEGEQEKELNLYAQSAVLMDAASGRILYGKEENLERPMASTTKIMTCILALENGSYDDVVTASSYAAGQPKVHLGVAKDQTFYLKDLLYSLMLESHNDAAVMIAEHIGGSVEGFAGMMNQKARDLGCEHTYFITPNGLDAEETGEGGERRMHSTTAADLARIMSYCVWESPQKEEFLEITQTQNYYFTDLGGKHSYNCTNHNAFLTMMNGMLSGKTGFTGGAGYSYIAAMEDGDRRFVAALLGCGWPPHKTYKWSDARALFQYGLEHYQYQEVYRELNLKPVPVENGVCQNDGTNRNDGTSQNDGTSRNSGTSQDACTRISLNLPEDQKTLKLLMKEGEKAEILCDVPDHLKAPVEAGIVVGSITYSLDGKPVKVYPIYTVDPVDERTLEWSIRQILDNFLIHL